MLRISKPEEHGVRLVMRLARQSGQRTLGELAAGELLPEPTVAKLLARLRDAGLVTAARGRRGGYELARPPARLNLAEVLGALGVPLVSLRACRDVRAADVACPRLHDCGLRPVWRHLERQVAGLLERLTIADLLEAEATVEGRVAALWPEVGSGAASGEISPQTAVAAAPGRGQSEGVGAR